jgi:hypothetical protein
MPGAPDPLYVNAREVLLDALEALGPHRASLILVGAQAIYLHTGEADIAVAPFTTDHRSHFACGSARARRGAAGIGIRRRPGPPSALPSASVRTRKDA